MQVGVNRLGLGWNYTTGVWGGATIHVVFDNTYLQSMTVSDRSALLAEVDAKRTVLVIVGTGDMTDFLITRVLQQATGLNAASGAPVTCEIEALPVGSRVGATTGLNTDVSTQFRSEANSFQYT